MLLYGRKRWFLRPPKKSIYSRKAILPWFTQQYPQEKRLPDTLYECVQQPGEMLYVPEGWSHGILNVETSIGAAMEFAPPGWTHTAPCTAERASNCFVSFATDYSAPPPRYG